MGNIAENTRTRIMQTAEKIILQKGFAATSIDEIIENAHITKGGFFYHFKGKNELALGLLNRYLESDSVFFNQLFDRARELTEDPLQQMLLFLKLLAEAMGQVGDSHPGCLVASFTYESQQFDEQVIELCATGTNSWRELFELQLALIDNQYSAKLETNLSELANMLTACIEGGIILARVLREPSKISEQILQYRNYIRLLYQV